MTHAASGTSRVLTVALLQRFKVEALILAPADCEVRSVIKFLNTQSIASIEIQNKLRGMPSAGVVLLHDNARRSTHLRQEFSWEVFNPFSAKGLGDRLYATLHKMPEEDDYSFSLYLNSKYPPLYTSGSHFIHSTVRSKPSLLNHFPIYYRLL